MIGHQVADQPYPILAIEWQQLKHRQQIDDSRIAVKLLITRRNAGDNHEVREKCLKVDAGNIQPGLFVAVHDRVFENFRVQRREHQVQSRAEAANDAAEAK